MEALIRRGLLVLFVCGAALAQSADQYGGFTSLPCRRGPQPHFYTEKINGQWWLCTPAGNAFWEVGVYNVLAHNWTDFQGVNPWAVTATKYSEGETVDPRLNWALQTVRRLKSWGFNTLEYAYLWIVPTSVRGEWQTADRTIPEKMAYVWTHAPSKYVVFNANGWSPRPAKDLMAGIKRTTYTGWRAAMVDHYDTAFGDWIEGMWKKEPPPKVNADWVIGVVIDDADYLWWARWGEDCPGVKQNQVGTHAGWAALVTAPVQTATYVAWRPATVVYDDTQVYTKRAMVDYLAEKYGSIAGLNAAWGSSYTSFNSTGTLVEDEVLGTADGTTVSFSGTLAQGQPSPWSLQVLLDGAPMAGDDGNGVLLGTSVASGTVNYATRALTVKLTAAPAADSVVSVRYVLCGFGCGTGLLDEDGSRPWVPRVSASNTMTGGTATLRQDLDEFLEQYARRYFATVKEKVAKYWPGYLYLGPTTLEGRAPVIRAASDYVDVIRFGMPDWMQPWYQERMDFIGQHGGDKPWMTWMGKRAVPDSYFASDPRGGACLTGDFETQEARGAWYEGAMRTLLRGGSQNVARFVGMQFWELYDNRRECANWGLMTPRDNPYDGVSARVQTGVDAWGYATGGEQRDFGDFISSVKRGNRWTVRASPSRVSVSGAGLAGRTTIQ